MEEEQQQVEEAEAAEYAAHPERFRVLSLILEIQGEPKQRIVTYQFPVWRCTCPYFSENRECRHVIATKMLYFEKVRREEIRR